MKLIRCTKVVLILLVLLALGAGAVVYLNQKGEEALPEFVLTSAQPATLPIPPIPPTPQEISRGAYLATAGNCAACHTAQGGAAYAGGAGIDTPFGKVYAGNLTPDAQTGLGTWSNAHFWRALHNGRSKDGHLLYPVFPFTNTTRVTREDSDALFAYLQSLPAVVQPQPANDLRFPFNTQAALAVWRALYFTPGADKPEPSRSAEWQRGAYLVRGLGHCNACHASRNAMGATVDNSSGSAEFGGGLIPMQGWYAPSLNASAEAGVADWSVQQVVDLLKNGVVSHDTVHASVLGPMAEVVYRSTQHLTETDLQAMAVFLKALPQSAPLELSVIDGSRLSKGSSVDLAKGQKLFELHCADCHGANGQGARSAGQEAGPLVYPALAGNRAVTMASSTNLVRIVRSGGFPAATAGNPRPYSMPPFDLSPEDLAVVVSYIRNAWGNNAAPITAAEVQGGR